VFEGSPEDKSSGAGLGLSGIGHPVRFQLLCVLTACKPDYGERRRNSSIAEILSQIYRARTGPFLSPSTLIEREPKGFSGNEFPMIAWSSHKFVTFFTRVCAFFMPFVPQETQ
jgi:hypothetical protein